MTEDRFGSSRDCLESIVSYLDGDEAGGLTHAELEEQIEGRGRELLRRLFQDHLVLRVEREVRLGHVADAEGITRPNVEADHRRSLVTVFGEVAISRLAYRRRGHQNRHPADGALNLPQERHSHGLRRIAAIEASRGSFEGAADAIVRSTGQRLGKRQVAALARRTAADIEDFYAARSGVHGDEHDALVVSVDGKGVVMRPDSLRPATKRAAEENATKLHTRLSKGEKRARKRMAELGAVYDLTPLVRSADDILAKSNGRPKPAPTTTKNKWLCASVVEDAAEVIAEVFDEAEQRDPDHRRAWVALVDGNNHQIDRIEAEATKRQVTVTVLVDLVHVLEYLWKAAWSFHSEGDIGTEQWVHDRALAVLEGGARDVAAGIRRRATTEQLIPSDREGADACAMYLTHKAPYLDYPTALANGWSIATGIIEGACRHIVADRMDLTGARWSLDGAEAVLKLRAVRANGDFDHYWRYHLAEERRRVHASRYEDEAIPQAA
ncbi:MAG: ISKra4 family transposase [Acidimicrobiales bacterium]